MNTSKNNERLVSVRVSEDVMMVKFLNENITTSPNEDQPWEMIEETFEWCQLDTLRLDFSCVKYLSSVALGRIVTLNKKFRDRLEISNLSDRIMEVFLVTGLDRVVTINQSSDLAAA